MQNLGDAVKGGHFKFGVEWRG